MGKRLRWIDVAKGFCLYAVMLGHISDANINRIVYPFHLTVFFLLSGYTLKKKEIDRDFVAGKFRRLMIPYFITCFCVTVMDVVNLIVQRHEYSIVQITRTLWLDLFRTFVASGSVKKILTYDVGVRIGAIWFLPAMFFGVLAAQFLVSYVRGWKKQFAIAGMLYIAGVLSAEFVWLPFSLQPAAVSVLFILCGYYIKSSGLLGKLKPYHYLLMAAVFLLSIYTRKTHIYFVSCSMGDLLYGPVTAISASLLVIGLAVKIGHFYPLEFVGKHSLLFLCVHLFEMETLRGYYFNPLRAFLHVDEYPITLFLIEAVFCTVISVAIVKISEIIKGHKASGERSIVMLPGMSGRRDQTLDIMRAILIVLMILGHKTVNANFRSIVYSIHMMAFVFISGYFYKPAEKNTALGRIANTFAVTLKPYAFFSLIYILINHNGIRNELVTLVLGMSYSKNIFTDAASVGPIYFLLLLLCVKVIYMILDLLPLNALEKTAACLGVSLAGVYLGNKGYWLPWSLDCGLYAVIFYHAGFYCRKNQILKKLSERPYMYFFLSAVWVYMIWQGSMELAVRKYSDYGTAVVGCLCGIAVLYLLCRYLERTLPAALKTIIAWTGRSTLYILIIHTLFAGRIYLFIHNLGLANKNIFNFTFGLILQLLLGMLLQVVMEHLGKNRKRRGAYACEEKK